MRGFRIPSVEERTALFTERRQACAVADKPESACVKGTAPGNADGAIHVWNMWEFRYSYVRTPYRTCMARVDGHIRPLHPELIVKVLVPERGPSTTKPVASRFVTWYDGTHWHIPPTRDTPTQQPSLPIWVNHAYAFTCNALQGSPPSFFSVNLTVCPVSDIDATRRVAPGFGLIALSACPTAKRAHCLAETRVW